MRLSDYMDFVVTGDELQDGWRVAAAVHAPERCEPPCVFHEPSAHPLAGAPVVLRQTMFGPLAFRECEHGVLHADPDSLAHLRRRFPVLEVQYENCCGCCGRLP